MPAAPHRGAPCEVHARDGGGIQTGDAPPLAPVSRTRWMARLRCVPCLAGYHRVAGRWTA